MKTLNIFNADNYSTIYDAIFDGALYCTKIPDDVNESVVRIILENAGLCVTNNKNQFEFTIGDDLSLIKVYAVVNNRHYKVFGQRVSSGYAAYSPDRDEDFLADLCICSMPNGEIVSLKNVLEYNKNNNITISSFLGMYGNRIYQYSIDKVLAPYEFNDSLVAHTAAYYVLRRLK